MQNSLRTLLKAFCLLLLWYLQDFLFQLLEIIHSLHKYAVSSFYSLLSLSLAFDQLFLQYARGKACNFNYIDISKLIFCKNHPPQLGFKLKCYCFL